MSGKRSTFSIPPPLQTRARPPPEGSEARPGRDRKAKLRVPDMLRGEQGCWGRAVNYQDEAAYEDGHALEKRRLRVGQISVSKRQKG